MEGGRVGATLELTNREYAILRGLAGGLTAAQTAHRIGIARDTVYRVQNALCDKLGAATAAQLVDRAWRLGVLTTATPLLLAEKPLPAVERVADPPALIRQRRHELNEALAGYRRPRREAA